MAAPAAVVEEGEEEGVEIGSPPFRQSDLFSIGDPGWVGAFMGVLCTTRYQKGLS